MMTAESFALRLIKHCGVQSGDHVLAAVSGGADSVALLCLLCDVGDGLGIAVSCAHVEHGIRGDVSLGDMAFVRELCHQKNIPFYYERIDVPGYAKANGCGLEEAARTLRHASLQRMAKEIGAQHVALAHHAHDQAETVLLHAARGSDVRGLCGMQSRRGNIIRPLLEEEPQALRNYLAAKGQSWREDETNLDVAYARNRVRHEALPALLAAYPGAVQALCRLAEAAQRDERHFEQLLDGLALTVTPLVDGAALVRRELAGLDDALLGRVLAREMERAGLGSQNAHTIVRIAEEIRAGKDAVINLQGGGHAYIGKKTICLIRKQLPVPETELALSGETQTPFGVFTVRQAGPCETGDGITSQAIDEAALTDSVITGRREGDTMIPFGRHTPVKLKKLMIDAGIERPVRNSLPVIRQGGNILWAVGLRPSAQCEARGGRRLMVEYRSNQKKTHAPSERAHEIGRI